ncbi:DUF305 domain-containing protein [Erythrobacter sp. R86502]|uniref:DUF305 domain-containing protein n=1 Tax=Erythrobacter sp. R86502 TaxID=3093846 RepID=UPI0036D36551
MNIAPIGSRATLFVPVGLAAALAITLVSYASLHNIIYDRASGRIAELLHPETTSATTADVGVPPGSFWRGSEHYYGDVGSNQAPSAEGVEAMVAQMDTIHTATERVPVTGDLNRDFVALMVLHHQAAIEMVSNYRESGTDPELRRMAEHIVAEQRAEIAKMHALI